MVNNFPGGVWPTAVTPFLNGQVDYESLERLIDWYIENGVSGLFSVCQSSEMFKLSIEERVAIASFVKEKAGNRVPVIASGHVSDSLEDQIQEINAIAATGVDAVILISNRLAKEDESDQVWIKNLETLLEGIDKNIALGFYECPYPYKRVLTETTVKYCAENERFLFLKDTSCDIENIKMKLETVKGSNLKIYNANTTTLLESLKLGCIGYSGVMANTQPQLYAWLCDNVYDERASIMSDYLTVCSLIERQLYPVNAKVFLKEEGIFSSIETRVKDHNEFTETFKCEVNAVSVITKELVERFNITKK